MKINEVIKSNYNSIAKLVLVLCGINIMSMFFIGCLALMFFKANFHNNNYQTQIVNVNQIEKEKIDINKCSPQALESLSGVGILKAENIIKGRPYQDIYQLKEIIGDKTFNNIKDKIKVE